MTVKERPATIHEPRTPPRAGRAVTIVVAAVLLILLGVYYYWMRPIQKESALEDSSIDQLKAMTSADPNNARAFYYLGKRIEQAGFKKDPLAGAKAASVELARAMKLAPDDEQIWIEGAGAANGAYGPTASFTVFDDFIKRHPQAKAIITERQSLLDSLQRVTEGYGGKATRPSDAIKFYGLWLTEEPKAVKAQDGLLTVLTSADPKTKGLQDGWLTLARVYDLQGAKDKAQEARSKAAQFAPIR